MAEGKEEWTPLFRASVRGHAQSGAGAGLADGPGADPRFCVLARSRARFPARFSGSLSCSRSRSLALAICAPPPRRANMCPAGRSSWPERSRGCASSPPSASPAPSPGAAKATSTAWSRRRLTATTWSAPRRCCKVRRWSPAALLARSRRLRQRRADTLTRRSLSAAPRRLARGLLRRVP